MNYFIAQDFNLIKETDYEVLLQYIDADHIPEECREWFGFPKNLRMDVKITKNTTSVSITSNNTGVLYYGNIPDLDFLETLLCNIPVCESL